MNTTLQSVTLIIACIVIGIALISSFGSSDNGVFGYAAPAYFYNGATNSSSSVPVNATTSNPILSSSATRINSIVCNNSATSTIFLHQKNISTTTGVVANEGIRLAPANLASSTNSCIELPGFRGYLFGIGTATSFVTISQWQ